MFELVHGRAASKVLVRVDNLLALFLVKVSSGLFDNFDIFFARILYNCNIWAAFFRFLAFSNFPICSCVASWVLVPIWIFTIGKYTNMLLQLLYFRLENSNFATLRFGSLDDILKILIQNLILISLRFNVGFKLFIILPSLNMQLILYHFSFLNQNVHDNINFFTDMVRFFLEKLQHVIPCY